MLLLVLLEGALVLVGLTGVAFIYWPAALILAGVLGVVLCERASVALRAKQAAEAAKVRPLRPRGEAA